MATPWDRSRPRSAEYGPAHTRARAAAALAHKPTDPCSRCGHPLGPMSPRLHLDHTDDRRGYLGFAHSQCNVQAGARAGRARQNVAQLDW